MGEPSTVLKNDELSGLGQEEELTLANEDQKSWRIETFIDALKNCKESVEYFDLNLEKLFELVKLLPVDEKIGSLVIYVVVD